MVTPVKSLTSCPETAILLLRESYTVKPGVTKQILGHIIKPVDFKEGEPVLIEDVRMANDERRNSHVRAILGFTI